MLRFAADENFNNNLLRALLRRKPDLDIVRIQDVGLCGADDPTVLEWAAREGRILLTHDVATITRYAWERLERGQRMAGVFEVLQPADSSRVTEDLILLIDCSLESEWEGCILYLPFP